MQPLAPSKQKRLPMTAIMSWFVLFTLASTGYTADYNVSYALDIMDNNRLSLDATGVPLEIILEDIQKETGLKMKIHRDHIGRTVSVNFKQLGLEQAIMRILRGINYICYFRSGGEVEKIITIPGSTGDADSDWIEDTEILPDGMWQKMQATVDIADQNVMANLDIPFESEDPGGPTGMMLAPAKGDIAKDMQIMETPANLRVEEMMEIEPTEM